MLQGGPNHPPFYALPPLLRARHPGRYDVPMPRPRPAALLSPDLAAALLGVTRQRVHAMIKQGQLPNTARLGRLSLIQPANVARLTLARRAARKAKR